MRIRGRDTDVTRALAVATISSNLNHGDTAWAVTRVVMVEESNLI